MRGPQGVAGADGQQGANGVNGNDGQNGADGVSVTGASVNVNGELVFNLSAGDPINVGDISGATVNDVQIDDQGVMQLFMSDGRLLTAAGNTKGPKGDKGEPGDAGGFVDGVNLGDTARWDGTQWVVDSALSNTGNGVGILTGTPHPSAALEVSSTTGGFLMPRMTSGERDTLLNPTPGLMVFNLTTGCFNHWSGAVWKELCASCEAPFVTPVVSGDNAVLCGAGEVTYSVPEIAGANAYTWSIPAGAILVSNRAPPASRLILERAQGGTWRLSLPVNARTARRATAGRCGDYKWEHHLRLHWGLPDVYGSTLCEFALRGSARRSGRKGLIGRGRAWRSSERRACGLSGTGTLRVRRGPSHRHRKQCTRGMEWRG